MNFKPLTCIQTMSTEFIFGDNGDRHVGIDGQGDQSRPKVGCSTNDNWSRQTGGKWSSPLSAACKAQKVSSR